MCYEEEGERKKSEDGTKGDMGREEVVVVE